MKVVAIHIYGDLDDVMVRSVTANTFKKGKQKLLKSLFRDCGRSKENPDDPDGITTNFYNLDDSIDIGGGIFEHHNV